ncbi:hypothetical protein JNW91_15765 [Micromonospora sp. STR1_7]|uniref:DUF2812 domain-containing protein n=1 Tax=Micromonospora parastrephiae TaxID=2806101 RepID=A0ABS1XV88_9ACTN|nr:hypothetical protein [Micromonospora parastrephiae]MBM0233192.1 hypothetical protein [Micromonospora parastrephiae]
MTAANEERPRYGYGRGGRPLGSSRDRDAEALRRVLRRAGLRDFDERHLDGFAVEGANSSLDGPEPFSVAYCGTAGVPEAMTRYRAVLQQAGYQVDVDPLDEHSLLVPRQPDRAAAPSDRGLMAAAVLCAVLATVALLASWIGSGAVRLTGGVGSAVFGVLAVFLAGLWYRRRAHLE